MKAVSYMIKTLTTVVLLGSITMGVHAADKVSGNLIIKGSDTMSSLGQVWAENFMKKNPATNVSVTGGGSGTGIAALINGTTDICQSSREMTAAELESAKKKGREAKGTIVGLDGISIVVNPKNPVKELSMDDLLKIFTGEVKNWKDFGGQDKDIILLSREVTSGTYTYFKDNVLKKKNFAANALLMPSNQAIVDEVTGNLAAIGYVGIAYAENPKVKAIPVKKTADSAAIPANEATVKSGKYPISRPLFVYTASKKSIVKTYIDFTLSDAGQKLLREVGFVPMN